MIDVLPLNVFLFVSLGTLDGFFLLLENIKSLLELLKRVDYSCLINLEFFVSSFIY
jgi:hypothetical protein